MFGHRVGSFLVTALSICLPASVAVDEPPRGGAEAVPLETVLNLLQLDSPIS